MALKNDGPRLRIQACPTCGHPIPHCACPQCHGPVEMWDNARAV
jgi:predicted amidophosphoribosyltransferase